MNFFSIIIRKFRTLFKISLPAIANDLFVEIHSISLFLRSYLHYRQYLNRISCDSELVSNLQFVTLGRVEFYDLLPIYTNLLDKNLTFPCNHTFVSDHYSDLCPQALVINKPFRWLVLELLERHIYSKYVVLLHLDYFLLSPVDRSFMEHCCNIMDLDNNIDFIQLARNVGEIDANSYDTNFNYLDDSSDLFFNMQVRIWRRSSLFRLFLSTSYNDISKERYYSRTCRSLGMQGIIPKLQSPNSEFCFNNIVYPYMATALNARKWRRSFITVLQPLLKSHFIDPEVRGWI